MDATVVVVATTEVVVDDGGVVVAVAGGKDVEVLGGFDVVFWDPLIGPLEAPHAATTMERAAAKATAQTCRTPAPAAH